MMTVLLSIYTFAENVMRRGLLETLAVFNKLILNAADLFEVYNNAAQPRYFTD